MVVMVFASASTLSTLIFISETFNMRSSSLYTFSATKQMHTCASMRLRVKWNMGRISIFDLAMRKARSTCQRLWYAVAGVSLYYLFVLAWKKKNLGWWAMWSFVCAAAVAFTTSGTVSRYILPYEPLFVTIAVWVLLQCDNKTNYSILSSNSHGIYVPHFDE